MRCKLHDGRAGRTIAVGRQVDMKDTRRSRRTATGDSRPPQIEDLSESAIKKRLRLDAMKHPVTIISLVLSILFVIIAILGAWWAIIPAIIAGIAALASFFWRYSVRHNEEYAKRLGELVDLHEQETGEREQSELTRLQQDIQAGFSRVNSFEGLKALQDLVHEYEQIQPLLEQEDDTDPMAVAHIPALAEETFRQGLGVLAGSLQLMREIRSLNNEKLKNEAVQLEQEIESLRDDESQTERLKILEATLASHKERLDMIAQQQVRVDGLLHQSDSCEASLHRVRIELATLRADSVDASASAVISALEKTISQAKEVQEELKKLGY